MNTEASAFRVRESCYVLFPSLLCAQQQPKSSVSAPVSTGVPAVHRSPSRRFFPQMFVSAHIVG